MEKDINQILDDEIKTPVNDAEIDDNGTELNIDIDEPHSTDDNVEAFEEPEFVPLDDLLYDNDYYSTPATESEDSFESFFAEYRQLIASSLDAAKKLDEEKSEEIKDNQKTSEIDNAPQAIDAPAEEEPKFKQVKSPKKPKKADSEEWSGEITLEPEEYESLDEESEIFTDEPIVEEEAVDLLGIEEENETQDDSVIVISDDNVQLSFFADTHRTRAVEEDPTPKREYDPENPRVIDYAFDFLELFIFTLLAVMILTTFLFRHSVVDGDSMNTTLSHGDHLIISNAFYSPERGDIIVFEDYSTELKKPVVKRIIGLPGDTVEVRNASDGGLTVYVNGEELTEEYAIYLQEFRHPCAGIWTVGDGELFVMGDNRYNSTDSRDERLGTISIDSVLGKVVLRFYPFADFTFFD